MKNINISDHTQCMFQLHITSNNTLSQCVVGLIGLILFSIAAKKYKYRARNAEDLFRQADIEEIYDRYIMQASMDSISDDKSV